MTQYLVLATLAPILSLEHEPLICNTSSQTVFRVVRCWLVGWLVGFVWDCLPLYQLWCLEATDQLLPGSSLLDVQWHESVDWNKGEGLATNRSSTAIWQFRCGEVRGLSAEQHVSPPCAAQSDG